MNTISNVNEYTVSELNSSIKKIIESTFNYIKVKGEVSQLTKHSSGHIYLTLKDEKENISAVCWRTKALNLSFIPEEGEAVIIEGRISTYSPQSKYQIIIDKIESEGEGSLLKTLEETKKKLLKEGIFDKKNKKEIPFIPKKICVITSENGSVIKDIIHRIKARFPSEILIFPVKVQGKECVKQIIGALEKINDNKFKFNIDVIIIARGGGSLEDLMPFNDEQLVRGVFKSEIPVISAIGHETDVTLCDFAADLRAPTPTAAAEFCVPVLKDLNLRVIEKNLNLNKTFKNLLEKSLFNLENLCNKIPKISNTIDQGFQSLDITEIKLKNVLKDLNKKLKIRLSDISGSLNSKIFVDRLKLMNERNNNLFQNLKLNIFKKIDRSYQQVSENNKLLNSLSYKNILERGYSVTRVLGKLVSDDNQIKTDDNIEIEYFKNKTIAKKL